MDKTIEPDVWKISRRFLFYYSPIVLCYLILSFILEATSGSFSWFSIIINMLLFSIMYLFIITPIIFIKPKKSSNRRLVMLLFTLLFTGITLYIVNKLLHTYDLLEISSTPISTSQAVFSTGYSALSIGIFICFFYYVEEKQFIAEKRISSERNKKLNNDKLITETHLKLLQAQIEPHFLFNTLTSILVLSEKEPRKAKIMHDNFMQYLKATLAKTRASVTTIGQDIKLIKAYLDIFKVRMKKRMQYSIEADDEVIDQPFPSMLIQPIVENAIKHGLEPNIKGGDIRIKVTKQERSRLRWEIADTGPGMSDKADMGTGLSNVIERIETLYGKEGHFSIKDNKPSGVKVTLEVPYA